MASSSGVYVPSLTISSFFPLTTIFTPPSNCFSDVGWYSPYGWPGSISPGLGPLEGCSPCWMGLPSSSSCFPSGWNVDIAASPGICPSGYTIACSSVNSVESETVGTCCPSGFICQPSLSDPRDWPWMSTELCTSPQGTNNITVTGVSSISTEFGFQTFTTHFPGSDLDELPIYAYSIEIRFSSTTSSMSQTKSTTSISHQTSYGVPSSTPTIGLPSKGRTGLSPGPRAGIAISVLFVFLSLILLSFVCLRRHGRRVSKIPERTDNLQGLFLKPELEAGNPQVEIEKPTATHQISELDSSPAAVSKNYNQNLGAVEDTLIPKDKAPSTVEMEAMNAPDSSVIQPSQSTVRTPTAEKSGAICVITCFCFVDRTHMPLYIWEVASRVVTFRLQVEEAVIASQMLDQLTLV